MEYLIALIPALGWGLMPLITGKMGGSEANQIFGIGAGASIVGIIAFLITQPTVSAGAFIFSMVCGALWSTAQIGLLTIFSKFSLINWFMHRRGDRVYSRCGGRTPDPGRRR